MTTALLVVAAVVVDQLGRAPCAWACGSPATGGADRRPAGTPARTVAGSRAREMLATDRASVWRSPSLRRGLLVLGILPGAVAAVAGLDWPSLVLLPGLVAAGAGLLFGVNAFCLDGTGAVWLASLPGDARRAVLGQGPGRRRGLRGRRRLTVAAGASRAGRPPTAGEAVALVGVRGRRRAPGGRDLHGALGDPTASGPTCAGPATRPPRPGSMAAYSARLAVSTTLVAVLFSTHGRGGSVAAGRSPSPSRSAC